MEQKGCEFLFKSQKFAEVPLPLDGEIIPRPKADFAAQFRGVNLFIELDTGQSVSHNVAKYYFVLERLKARPETVFLLHLLGPGFKETQNNYRFHKELATFLSNKIQETFRDTLKLSYVQSEILETNEAAIDWLRKEMQNITIQLKDKSTVCPKCGNQRVNYMGMSDSIDVESNYFCQKCGYIWRIKGDIEE